MAPATPSASISVSVCGRSGQCFRSYPRNYTSVWLSAPAPGPQDVGTRYQTLLIACRLLTPPPLDIHSHLFLSGPLYTSSPSFRLLSRRITNNARDVLFLNKLNVKERKRSRLPSIYLHLSRKTVEDLIALLFCVWVYCSRILIVCI